MGTTKKLLVILVLSANLLLSQTLKQSKIGICGGIAYNTQVKTKESFAPVSFGYYNTTSPFLGLIYRDSINKWFSIKTSLYYLQRGVKFSYKYESPYYNLYSDQKFTGHYLSFPINLNFNFKNFFIGVGLEGSLLIKAHHQVHIKEITPSYVNDNSLDAWYGEKFYQIADAGYTFNMGYRIKNFEVEFNMFHGLIAPPKFQYFTSQHFEFKYAYQQTFRIGINYFPKFKRYLPKTIK